MSGVIASIGIAAGTATMSFVQASKQKKLQMEAQASADLAMAEAKKRLELNVFEKLGIAKLPYEQAREDALVQGAMATEAARESDRGAAAAAGRIQMAQQEQQAAIAAKQEQELMNLEKTVATEQGRLLDIGTQLNLEEVAGAQQAAAQAQEAAAAATAQGIQSLSSGLQTAVSAAPLYTKSASVRQTQKLTKEAAKANINQEGLQNQLAGFGTVGGVDLSGVGYTSNAMEGKMTELQFKDFMSRLTPTQLKAIRQQMGLVTNY